MNPASANFSYSLQTPTGVKKFRVRLLQWFDGHQRALPWRTKKPSPYQIWISEIMLQQTRVAVVVNYYRRFLLQFPSVSALAAAREQQVLAAWSGLGYYRRARMLHQAAKKIVGEKRGRVPRTTTELRTLPGVGRYTAAAIASIAFGEPVAVVDGNVERVLDRLLGYAGEDHKKDYWAAAEHLLDRSRPGDFNQAMMELGATICLPRSPDCGSCPMSVWCGTRGEHRVVKSKSRRTRTSRYLLATKKNKVALVQRPHSHELMASMWELPSAPGSAKNALMRLKHSITTSDYHVTVFTAGDALNSRWIPIRNLEKIPLTGLARKILQRAGVLNINRTATSPRRNTNART